MADRFRVRRALHGLLAGHLPLGNSLLFQVGLCQVLRQGLRMGVLHFRELPIDDARNDQMEFLAPALQQCLVGCVADQRMLELVNGVWRDAAHVEQFSVGELAECGSELRFRNWMYCVQQRIGKIVTEYSTNLDYFLSRPESVQPRHQRIMQSDRDPASGWLRVATLEHRPG